MQPSVDTCPVCAMKVKSSSYKAEHYQIVFHFCSEQCQSNFLARPNLYVKYMKLPPQPHDEILKKRTLHLMEALDSEQVAVVYSHLQQLMGIRRIDVEADQLKIEYDLLQVTETQIEQVLNEVGVALGEAWLDRLRRAWVHELETNELDNLAGPPRPHCHRSPPGT